MENIQKHISHWQNGAMESIETAEILIDKNKILFGLFFCHLAMEKLLKALYIQSTNDFPPKTHKLLYLSDTAGLEIKNDIKLLFSTLMSFQLEGRYPEISIQTPNHKKAINILTKTKEALLWFQKKLDQS